MRRGAGTHKRTASGKLRTNKQNSKRESHEREERSVYLLLRKLAKDSTSEPVKDICGFPCIADYSSERGNYQGDGKMGRGRRRKLHKATEESVISVNTF